MVDGWIVLDRHGSFVLQTDRQVYGTLGRVGTLTNGVARTFWREHGKSWDFGLLVVVLPQWLKSTAKTSLCITGTFWEGGLRQQLFAPPLPSASTLCGQAFLPQPRSFTTTPSCPLPLWLIHIPLPHWHDCPHHHLPTTIPFRHA